MSSLEDLIGSGKLVIGKRSYIDPTAQFSLGGASKITIGDYCNIGAGVKVVCDGGTLSIGDWTSVHDRVLIISGEGVNIGQHCWFGQGCVIDGTGLLNIGNGVRVGMYSQIWSHAAAGEQIEGCTLHAMRPVNIENDVWLVGSCIVGSGVTLGRRTIALIGSNITRSTTAGAVVAGAPAREKVGLNFYIDLSMERKWTMLKTWLLEAEEQLGIEVQELEEKLIAVRLCESKNEEFLCFVRSLGESQNIINLFPNATVCSLSDKKYNKKHTDIENVVLKYLSGNKARFYS